MQTDTRAHELNRRHVRLVLWALLFPCTVLRILYRLRQQVLILGQRSTQILGCTGARQNASHEPKINCVSLMGDDA
jgi:hypothetical protein